MVRLTAGGYGLSYRYAEASEHPIPELSWVHEAVERLIGTIEADLVTSVMRNNVPGPSKTRLTFGKPTYTTQAVPLKPGP
jgi:hypothetical protein